MENVSKKAIEGRMTKNEWRIRNNKTRRFS
jgi:hypothetical protein